MDQLLAAAFTFLAGVLLFVITELTVRPIIKLREQLGLIHDRLIFYSDILTSAVEIPNDYRLQAKDHLRSTASQLRSKSMGIIWRRIWSKIKIIPKNSDIDQASKDLIGLSNSLWSGIQSDSKNNIKRIKSIEKCLNIKILE